jgi:hypothetical protein
MMDGVRQNNWNYSKSRSHFGQKALFVKNEKGFLYVGLIVASFMI